MPKYSDLEKSKDPRPFDPDHPERAGLRPDFRKKHEKDIRKKIRELYEDANNLDPHAAQFRNNPEDFDLGTEGSYEHNTGIDQAKRAQNIDKEMAKLYSQYNPELVNKMKDRVIAKQRKRHKDATWGEYTTNFLTGGKTLGTPVHDNQINIAFRPVEQVRHLTPKVDVKSPGLQYTHYSQGDGWKGERTGALNKKEFYNPKTGKRKKPAAHEPDYADRTFITLKPNPDPTVKTTKWTPPIPRQTKTISTKTPGPNGTTIDTREPIPDNRYDAGMIPGLRGKEYTMDPNPPDFGNDHQAPNRRGSQLINLSSGAEGLEKIIEHPELQGEDAEFPKILKFGKKAYRNDPNYDPEGQAQLENRQKAKMLNIPPPDFTPPRLKGGKHRMPHRPRAGESVPTAAGGTPTEREIRKQKLIARKEKEDQRLAMIEAQKPAPVIPQPQLPQYKSPVGFPGGSQADIDKIDADLQQKLLGKKHKRGQRRGVLTPPSVMGGPGPSPLAPQAAYGNPPQAGNPPPQAGGPGIAMAPHPNMHGLPVIPAANRGDSPMPNPGRGRSRRGQPARLSAAQIQRSQQLQAEAAAREQAIRIRQVGGRLGTPAPLATPNSPGFFGAAAVPPPPPPPPAPPRFVPMGDPNAELGRYRDDSGVQYTGGKVEEPLLPSIMPGQPRRRSQRPTAMELPDKPAGTNYIWKEEKGRKVKFNPFKTQELGQTQEIEGDQTQPLENDPRGPVPRLTLPPKHRKGTLIQAPAPEDQEYDDDDIVQQLPTMKQRKGYVGRYGGKKGQLKFQGGAYRPTGQSGWDDDEQMTEQPQQGGIFGRLAGMGGKAAQFGSQLGTAFGNVGAGLAKVANPANQIVGAVGGAWDIAKDMFGIQAAREKEIRQEEEQRYKDRLEAAEKLRQQQRQESQDEREQRIVQEKADQEDMIKKVIQDQYRATEASQYGQQNAHGSVHWEGSIEGGDRRLVSELDDLGKLKKKQATQMTEELGKENAVGQVAKDVQDSLMEKFDRDSKERFADEQEALVKDLLSRGQGPGSPAWRKSMRALQQGHAREREDARTNSIEQGHKYGAQAFDQKLQIYDKMNSFQDPLETYQQTSGIGTQHIEKAVLPSAEFAAQRSDADANNTNEANRYALDVQKARQEADARQREMESQHELQDEKAVYDEQADRRRYRHEDEADTRRYAHEDEQEGAKFYHDAGMQSAKFEHEDDANLQERKWKQQETKKERRDRKKRELRKLAFDEKEGIRKRQSEKWLQDEKIRAQIEDRNTKFAEAERIRLNENEVQKKKEEIDFVRKDQQAQRLLKKNHKYKLQYQKLMDDEARAIKEIDHKYAGELHQQAHAYEMAKIQAEFAEKKSVVRDMLEHTGKVFSMGMEAFSAANQFRATGSAEAYQRAQIAHQRLAIFQGPGNRRAQTAFMNWWNPESTQIFDLQQLGALEKK
jgi:hypothetical protein